MERCLLITLMDVCAYVSTECSGLMMTGEFSHIVGKLLSELKLVTDNLLFG